jgi:hypothetical protein
MRCTAPTMLQAPPSRTTRSGAASAFSSTTARACASRTIPRSRTPIGSPSRPGSTRCWPTRAVVCRKDGSYILYNYSGGFSWYLFGPDNRLQYDIAGTIGTGAWGYIVGTYDKDAGTNNQRLYLNGTRVAQMSDTLPIDLNSAALGIGQHVSGIADPFNGHIDEFRIAHVQRSDGWIETTWNNMSEPGTFAAAGPEEQEGGEPPPLASVGLVVCLMA